MKAILITGATGFLGSHILESLIAQKFNVIIIKRSTSKLWRIKHLLNLVKCYDVDKNSLNNIFEENKVECIIHVATLYRKYDDGAEVEDMLESNVIFPTLLLELAARNGVKKFINTGTYFEYDCSKLPVSEDTKICPFNFYAKTKLAFETLLFSYSNSFDIVTFRLFSPYGEKDNNKLIPMIIQKALAKEKIEFSEGLQRLDFIYIKDIVSAYLTVLNEPQNKLTGYRIYNLGTGVSTSVREVVAIIEDALNVSIHKSWGISENLDIPIVYADISKANKELNWYPCTEIRNGIEKTIQYYKKL